MAAASLDEVGNFFSRVGIDDTAKFWRAAGRVAKHSPVVGNHADLDPAYASMTGNDLVGVIRLELIQMSFVEHTIQQLAHVVGLAMIFRNNVIDLFQGSSSILAGGSQAPSLCTPRQLRHQLANPGQAVGI